ncbi:MAG: LPS export ABC transporter permease LptF [Burkholderiaceae bacterium]
MLLHSALRKELSQSFGATLVVLSTIVMTMMLIRTLRLASRGNINPSDVMQVLGYTVLAHLPTLLALSLFIAIVGTLSRLYRDHEMVIWFASGQSLIGLLNPLLRFAWPILLSVGLLALLAWPWANKQARQLTERYEKRGDLDRIAPGQFKESSTGSKVFFIDKDTQGNKVAGNVFISATERGKQSVTAARSGRIDTVGGQQFLLLQDGQRLEIPSPSAASPSASQGTSSTDIRISEFKEYGVLINEGDLAQAASALPKLQSSLDLVLDPTRAHLGELAWRIGLVLAALNFVIIAASVSRVHPRAGRSANLLFALLTFIVYYNLLNLGQNWVTQGKISFPALLLGLHGGVLVLALLWLVKINFNLRLRDLLALRSVRPRAPAVGA